MKPLSRTKKRRLVEDARRMVKIVWGPDEAFGTCSLASISLQLIAYKRHRLTLMLQAGTCAWRRLEQDSGEEDIDFGYEWQGKDDRMTQLMLAAGHLPECHVWLADRETREVIDPTSGDFPSLARSLKGYAWPGPKPPAWLWADVLQIKALIPRAVYIPSDEATVVVDQLLVPAYQKALHHLGLQRDVVYTGPGATGQDEPTTTAPTGD